MDSFEHQLKFKKHGPNVLYFISKTAIYDRNYLVTNLSLRNTYLWVSISFANINFPAVCDNEPEPHEIQVNFIPPNRCPVLTVDSRTVVIDEGHLASNAGALFDTDGSVVD